MRSERSWEADTVVLPVPARPARPRHAAPDHREPARTPAGPARSTVLVVVAVVVAVIGAVGYRLLPAPDVPTRSVPAAAPQAPIRPADDVPRPHPPPGGDVPGGDHQGSLGRADGLVPDGVTVFDDDVPAVGNLDPDLLDALREAATDAAGDGVRFSVNSGWRSPQYQAQLLREAVSQYGSEEEAARWVSTPETSLHVSGDAIDLGPAKATTWLSRHGADHGLCQVYRNEPWHYELRPDAVDDGCPPPYADPTHDPRMQK